MDGWVADEKVTDVPPPTGKNAPTGGPLVTGHSVDEEIVGLGRRHLGALQAGGRLGGGQLAGGGVAGRDMMRLRGDLGGVVGAT